MKLLQNKKIAIIGGGPSGLVLARLLQMKNIDVKVYEIDFDKQARQQGATLDLHDESGLEAMRRAGLEKEFYANYRPEAGKLRITDHHANIKLDDHSNDNQSGEDRPEIDRGPLRNILVNSLLQNTIVWNSKFEKMIPLESGWELFFENGNTAYADTVVAADGANSKLRPYLTDIKPIYSGMTTIEANIYNAEKNAPNLWELVKGGKVFALGNAQTIILSAKGDGSLSFYTGHNCTEQWIKNCGIDFTDKKQVHNWFKKEFANWDKVWQEIFNSDESWFVPRPMYHFPLDQKWQSKDNLIVIGDAAHRMPPYAGEGANMAMQDAFELAEYLTDENHQTILEAIENFEAMMQKRAAEATEGTLQNTALMHSENGLLDLLNFFNQPH
jgi:2-polyprenyl-6-methoxyphenol hydroxylase-like FAD-dependent oxidoreductase